MSLARAQQIADAALYEGYLLYPYRASAIKNRFRWPFGVVAPRAWAESGGSERWRVQTDCLVEHGGRARLHLRIRWLRVRQRRLEEPGAANGWRAVERLNVDGRTLVAWEEGEPSTIDLEDVDVARLCAAHLVHPVSLEATHETEIVRDHRGRVRGRIVRERGALRAWIAVGAEPCGSLTRLRVEIENHTPIEAAAGRDAAMRHALTGAHVMLGVREGAFVSLLDPPPGARDAAAACLHEGLWPVLVGPAPARDVLLACPIVLSDYPAIAPESPGDLCDATEIDELLTLRILTLTDAEQAEARATDERARLILERSSALDALALERLHGAIRAPEPAPEVLDLPPGETLGGATVHVGGVAVGRGTPVVLRPQRRADTLDRFLDGQRATVAGVYRDAEDRLYVAVTVDTDPARELHGGAGRYYYFSPEEIEPAGSPPPPAASAQEVES